MSKKIKKNHLNFWGLLLPLTIFTKEIGMVSLGGIQFDIISYPFFVIAFSVFFLARKLTISKTELIVFSFILVIGMIVDIILNLPMILFFKQFIPIVIIYFSIKYILLSNNPIYIFEKYIYFAVVAAIIGIVQLGLKPFGILLFTDYTGYFIDSIALEPSHYVVMMLPSVLYLYMKKEFSWRFWLILVTILLTMKLTALLSIGIFLIVINLRKLWKLIIMILPVLALGIYIVSITPEFADRINTAIAYVESGNIEDVRNKTTFSFVSNLEVATVNFLDTYGLGVGLGGHETTYLRNFNMSVFSEHWYGLNYKSGHALTIRIISELGILGIMIFFMMFYKTLKIKDTIFRSIALASLGHFIATSFKLGSYLDYGTIFMFVMIITMIKLDRRKSKDIKKGLII